MSHLKSVIGWTSSRSPLRQMYWEEAMVHVHTAYLGHDAFSWSPNPEWGTGLSAGVLEPITIWVLTSTMAAEDLGGLTAHHRQ